MRQKQTPTKNKTPKGKEFNLISNPTYRKHVKSLRDSDIDHQSSDYGNMPWMWKAYYFLVKNKQHPITDPPFFSKFNYEIQDKSLQYRRRAQKRIYAYQHQIWQDKKINEYNGGLSRKLTSLSTFEKIGLPDDIAFNIDKYQGYLPIYGNDVEKVLKPDDMSIYKLP